MVPGVPDNEAALPTGRPIPGSPVGRTLDWYAVAARDLPWRRPGTSPWAVMVSEFMLQQTPVERVKEPELIERWPEPAVLADAPVGAAIRAWGRLGYPRRALRLHAAATAIVDRHEGAVPASYRALLQLPGVGDYTAAAIASFAFGQRHVVVDTNVRRLLARVVLGEEFPGRSPAAERVAATELLPRTAARAARWAVASMELGALVCTASNPRCEVCPVGRLCTWKMAGKPVWQGKPRVSQTYEGTDRQCRGVLLAVLRSRDEPVEAAKLESAWPEPAQSARALASLLADGLVARSPTGALHLPG